MVQLLALDEKSMRGCGRGPRRNRMFCQTRYCPESEPRSRVLQYLSMKKHSWRCAFQEVSLHQATATEGPGFACVCCFFKSASRASSCFLLRGFRSARWEFGKSAIADS